MELAKILDVALEKVLFYTEVKVLVKVKVKPFRKRFSNLRSNRLHNATVCETPMLEKYFNS